MNIPLETYQKYRAFGWSVIPWTIQGPHEKYPPIKWKEYQTRFPTDEEIAGWADRYNAIALVTGKLSGVVVVDIDEEDQSKYPYLVSPVVVKSAFSGGRHYYYAYEPRLASFGPQAKIEGMPMDYRGEGGVVILPESNLDEKNYQFLACEPEILTPLPDEVFVKLANPKPRFERGEVVQFDELHSTGDRNQSATQIVGKLLEGMKQELWEVAGWTSLQKWNDTQCDPPLSEHELRGIFESIAAKEAQNRIGEVVWTQESKTFTQSLKEHLEQPERKIFYSGYTKVDAHLHGFQHGNAYLVSGLDKSGKSSWLMKMIQMQLEQKKIVGYVNTELPQKDFVRKMAGYWKRVDPTTLSSQEILSWSETFSPYLRYLGIETMPVQEKMLKIVEGFVKDGIECLVFDNITSWGNKIDTKNESWQVTADLTDSLIQMTKRNNLVTFMVRHLNPSVIDSGGLTTFKKIMESEEFGKIFEDQISVVKRPTTANIYGGGQITSQVSGTIILWRPYQKFTAEEMNRRSAIMIESFRHAPNAMIPAHFIGNMGVFEERESFTEDDVPVLPKKNIKPMEW